MYKIFMYEYSRDNVLQYSPLTIYDDESSDISTKVISPVLTLEDNTAGSLKFKLPVRNVGYGLIKVFKSTLVVKRRVANPSPSGNEWEIIWEGRVISETRDFFNQKDITCEGALAYLNDMQVLKWTELQLATNAGVERHAAYNNKSIQFMAIFHYLLRDINSDISAVEYRTSYGSPLVTQIIRTYDRRIFVNDSFIATYYGDNILDFSSDNQGIFDYICDSIINRHGGHVKLIRRSPVTSSDADSMAIDPIDEGVNPGKSGLYMYYVEEYYSLDISTDVSKAYSKGEHIIQNGKVYRFIEAHEANTPFDLDEVEEIPDVKVCKIEFQKNLVDIMRETDGGNCATAVLVLGASHDYGYKVAEYDVWDSFDSLDQTQQNHNKWFKSRVSWNEMVDHQLDSEVQQECPMDPGFLIAYDYSPLRFSSESASYRNYLYYVVNVAAASKYGFIPAKMTSNESNTKKYETGPLSGGEYTDYSGSARMYQAGIEYLKSHDPDYYSVEVTGLDFNFVDKNTPYANIGDIFYVDSPIHGMNNSIYFILTRMSIPLDSPESTKFTLNRSVSRSLSSYIK